MKKIFLFFFFLLIPIGVNAEDIVIDELNVINGELSLKFEPLNTEYTVLLDNAEFNLELDYKVKPGVVVSINNNNDLENNSVVTLTIAKDNNKVDYHFYILKDEPTTVMSNLVEEKIVKENFMFKYKIYIIPLICFILIIFCYKIIFRHKKKIT